jgi:hypothetical protein
VGDGNGQYTQETYDTFVAAITEAETVCDTPAASNTQSNIDGAAEALRIAVKNFTGTSITVDADGLASLIQIAMTKKENATYGECNGDYDPAQETVLSDAITTAQAIAYKVDRSPAEVSDAISDLQTAITSFSNTLVVVSYTALEAKINEARAITRGNYTEASWEALQAAIEAAEAMARDGRATQAEVDGALPALIIAIEYFHDNGRADENIGAGNGYTGAGGGSSGTTTGQSDTVDLTPIPIPGDSGAMISADNPFIDVKPGDWFYEDMMFVYGRGLFKGTSAAEFSPSAPMTRGMIVTVLYRMASEPAVSGANAFSDVANGKYYADAIAWAASVGIIDGYGDGLFGPDDNITRQDMAVIFLRYAEYADLELPTVRSYAAFSDDNAISGYARSAIETLHKAGILGGKPGNRLDPKGTATRAEFAAVLHRFIETTE